MKLYIDTSDNTKLIVGVNGKLHETSSTKRSQILLSFIEEVLIKEKIEINELTSIEVNSGPGSYTGLRVGVAVATTIGWILGVSVNKNDIRKGQAIEINY